MKIFQIPQDIKYYTGDFVRLCCIAIKGNITYKLKILSEFSDWQAHAPPLYHQ